MIQHRIVGPAFDGYTDNDIRKVRNLALIQLMDAPTVEDSRMLQEAIDSCNAELKKRGVKL